MFLSVIMFVFGLHSIMEIWMCGIIIGGGMNLVSLFWAGVKFASKMFL